MYPSSQSIVLARRSTRSTRRRNRRNDEMIFADNEEDLPVFHPAFRPIAVHIWNVPLNVGFLLSIVSRSSDQIENPGRRYRLVISFQ